MRTLLIFGGIALFLLIFITGSLFAYRASAPGVDDDSTTDNLERIGTVDDRPLTASAFQNELAILEANFDVLQKIDADDLDPASASYLPLWRERFDWMNEQGLENVALANLILREATIAYAEAEGVNVDKDVANQANLIPQTRANLETSSEGQNSLSLFIVEAGIDAVGEDTWWNDVAPAQTREGLIRNQLTSPRQELTLEDVREERDLEEPAEWDELQQQIIADTDIDITHPEAIDPATLDEALAVLERQ